MKKFYKGTVELELNIEKAIEKHQIIGELIIGWLRKVISEDVKTYLEFKDIPVFTEEHIQLKPELRQLIVKSSQSIQLDICNEESKKLIKHWEVYRNEHDINGVIENWNPFNDSEIRVIRKAFPFGLVTSKRCDTTNQVIFESDCDEPNLKLVTEISEKEYLELASLF